MTWTPRGGSRPCRRTGSPRGPRRWTSGPQTRKAFAEAIGRARTLFWNGPLGVFEKPPFDAGTREVAQALAGCPGFSVIGGGETVAAVNQAGVADKLGHVSTGGGASLEFLAGKTLPGVAVLRKNGEGQVRPDRRRPSWPPTGR